MLGKKRRQTIACLIAVVGGVLSGGMAYGAQGEKQKPFLQLPGHYQQFASLIISKDDRYYTSGFEGRVFELAPKWWFATRFQASYKTYSYHETSIAPFNHPYQLDQIDFEVEEQKQSYRFLIGFETQQQKWGGRLLFGAEYKIEQNRVGDLLHEGAIYNCPVLNYLDPKLYQDTDACKNDNHWNGVVAFDFWIWNDANQMASLYGSVTFPDDEVSLGLRLAGPLAPTLEIGFHVNGYLESDYKKSSFGLFTTKQWGRFVLDLELGYQNSTGDDGAYVSVGSRYSLK